MFRNPRENVSRKSTDQILPSAGRPPTPPRSDSLTETPSRSPFFADVPNGAVKNQSSPITPLPVLGRAPMSKTSTSKKNGLKPNQSILNFFGKTEKKEESPSKESTLFFEEKTNASKTPPILRTNSISSNRSHDAPVEDTEFRYNEDTTPVKRRRISTNNENNFMIRTPSPDRKMKLTLTQNISAPVQRQAKQRGGFVEDSSDEEDCTPGAVEIEDNTLWNPSIQQHDGIDAGKQASEDSLVEKVETTTIPLKPPDIPGPRGDSSIPTLHRESTSTFNPGDFGEEDFDDEFFPEGEEYLERRYMEEQLAMERAFEDDSKSESGTEGARTPRYYQDIDDVEETGEAVATCPMCDGNLKGLSEAEASSHVNACLDGTTQPLPKVSSEVQPTKTDNSQVPPSRGPKRFQRAAVARPGQANPFSHNKDGNSKSAFARLMSGHAEDAAWAEAAASEANSRGKPAYQRTCPFYKIMPGLFICVDAFRYGKVEGQNAYFLSHFHSDHYIGLTSQWCHGPIYASKVTCNLMRQQLKVDPKWIVPLEFEKKVEVPDTNGVFVTMIPANHCPGSSLYLFEKVMGKNRDGSPRLTRILHCGDFRACPAHVQHPLLKPNVLDAVNGQTKEQSIDTCYLDTTYLTPKYSFPSQHDVIDACAQMCVSLSKEIIDTSDGWERVKLERAGSTMKKFLEQGVSEQDVIKAEKEDQDEEDSKPKLRGRLLVVIGTYSIGKERICLGIARALNSKIYAPPSKMRICRALEDPDLNALLTPDPLEAQVHMQMLMEIRAETLHDYLVGFKPHFSRIVGFRPTGWSYRPPTSRFTENPAIQTVLHSEGWKSRFTMRDLVPQRGSTKESNCFGVPYSEHSSFRELTMFCCALRIKRIIPTVNVGSARSREKMKGWIEKWDADKRKNGLYQVEEGPKGWGSGDGALRYGV